MKKLLQCAVVFAFAFLTNCSKNADVVNPNLIGTNGGNVKSSDNTVTVQIPSGALSTSTVISIAETNTHPADNVGKVYELGPDGTQFNNPITITFKYNEADVNGFQSDLRMAFVDDNNEWSMISSTVNQNSKTVAGAVDHFTTFGLVMLPASSIILTTWDFTFLFDEDTWHADVIFYANGTTYYDEPESPGVFTEYGTWSMEGNNLTWDLDGEVQANDAYVMLGTMNTAAHTMAGTLWNGTRNWTAVIK